MSLPSICLVAATRFGSFYSRPPLVSADLQAVAAAAQIKGPRTAGEHINLRTQPAAGRHTVSVCAA